MDIVNNIAQITEDGCSCAAIKIINNYKKRVSEFFNRKWGSSPEIICRLHSGWGIPADVLIIV
jgi:antitoxin component HigA of HigAB toxin-antitoxin module